jgi:UDP-N-acetylmuramoyl-L-alanyl-D-glutamate--2,6-diaminopimelate ligase
MRLSDLLILLPHQQIIVAPPPPAAESSSLPNPEISGLAYDSRAVQPGYLFVAIKGYHVDGHAYIPQALARGAAAVVVDKRYAPPNLASSLPGNEATVALLPVPNSRAVLAPLAAAWYGFPGQRLGVVGITGTKGKTTTTTLVSHLLEQSGHQTGMISTVDLKIGAQQWHNTMRQSTPEALEIQHFLHTMVEAGCAYAVLEASSHGLAASWNRLGCCAFDVAVCTNVTHEHLDFHGTIEHYRRDKTRLFALLAEELPPAHPQPVHLPHVAIVNADDPHHQMFLDAAPPTAQRLTYAINTPADVRGHVLEASPLGTQARIETPWGAGTLTLHMPGTFNLHNAMAALSVALSQGVGLEPALTALGQVRAIRGRMERIEAGQPFDVIVDYAHNPDSFTRVMQLMRPFTRGRMIAVFGSAGERDHEKRPQQGAIAARYCELLVLTDEDPRGEERAAILAEIAAGAEQQGKKQGEGYLLIPDRSAAIRAAFERAQPGDLVLLLGKGHESSIEYADGKHPWDEPDAARAALHAMGYGENTEGEHGNMGTNNTRV